MILFRVSFSCDSTHRLLALSLISYTLALSAMKDVQAQAITYDTITLTGDPAPGTGPGVSFSPTNTPYLSPTLNDSGQIAFQLGLTGTGVDLTNNRGIFSNSGGTLGLVAREGQSAPGTGAGVNFNSFFEPRLNDAGHTAFLAVLTGTDVDSMNDRGIFSESGGALGLVAREGNAAPGTTTGVNFLDFRYPVLNESSQTAFYANLVGEGVDSTNDSGIFSESSGTLGLVAREGDPAPGTEPGVNFGGFSSSFRFAPVLNNVGQTAFLASLAGTGVDSTNNLAIFSESGGTLDLVAREGSPAPGVGPGVNFTAIGGNPVLNDLGQTAFLGSLAGPGVDGTNNSAIFSESGGTLGLVAREGDPAPGAGPGVNLQFTSNSKPVLNNAGQTAFLSSLTGTGVSSANNEAIFTESGGTLGLVAREGDAVPGIGPGVNFSNLGSPILNNAGQTAFSARLAGTGVEFMNNDDGFFATDLAGSLHLVAREGDLFDVNPDPFITENRTIRIFDFASDSGGSDGRPRGFNDAGQLALRLEFTDGTQGIFVATIVVPEPASLTLSVLGMSMFYYVGSSRRSRR